jgi:uncharacterized protein (DUF433 family)
MATTEYAHICLTHDNVPMLEGTQVKVVEIALDHLVYGWDALEIHRQHPHLSLGQILSALAYYYDHKAEMDADIQRRHERAEKMRAQLGDGPASEKLGPGR